MVDADREYRVILGSYEAGELEQSLARALSLLQQTPRHIPTLLLAGVVAAQLMQLDTALELLERAQALDPQDPRVQFNMAGVLLMRGDWAPGLQLYESRWRLGGIRAPAAAAGSVPWRGQEPLQGRSILIRCEQGIGDTLQFCRYVPLVAQLGAEVTLVVQRALISMLADLPGVSRIIAEGAPVPATDFDCPLLSLPLAFGTTPASIPRPDAYLACDSWKMREWQDRMPPCNGLRIGIAWRGTASKIHDGLRSLPLHQLSASLPQAHQYHSLQKHLPEEDRVYLQQQPWIADHSADLHDFSDTAALCACLDLVISVDTSVAHLAAGLGRPTWMLLHRSAAWRWLTEREDTPWYRSARLLRQTTLGDWADVCARIPTLLSEVRG